jgi:hypothetical protein
VLTVVIGATVSTVQVRATVVPAFPSVSTPRTRKVLEPSDTSVNDLGLVQVVKVAPFIEHSKRAKSAAVLEKANCGSLLLDRSFSAGPEPSVTVGPVVSTTKVRVSESPLPAASVAVTVKVCDPSDTPVVGVKGEEQTATVPESIRHRFSVEPVLVKVNVGVVSFVEVPSEAGLVIVTSGGVVSTVRVRVAGVGSELPAASVAKTVRVCEPSDRGVVGVKGEVQATGEPESI